MIWQAVMNDSRAEDLINLLNEFPDLLQVVTCEGSFLFVNQLWRRRLGYTDQDVAGMSFLDIIHPDHQQPWKSIFRAVLNGNRLDHFEMVLIAKDGSQVPVDSSLWSHHIDGKPAYVVANFRDAVSIARGEQQVSKLLYRDEYTGLLNRRGFAVRSVPVLEIIEENSERLSGWGLAIHANNHSDIERMHGIHESQAAIKLIADVLRKALRTHDLLARLDRDNFAAMITLPPKYQISFVLARVKAALQHANRQAAKPYLVELSYGFVEIGPDEIVEDALKKAQKTSVSSNPQARAIDSAFGAKLKLVANDAAKNTISELESTPETKLKNNDSAFSDF